MSAKVKPMADYVVAQAEEAPTKTASGFYLPQNAVEKPKIAKVVAIGGNVKDVKVGDRILYKNEYEAVTVKVDGEASIVVAAQNIIATIG